MKQKQIFARPALGLLLAAAALPFTPAFAQDAVPVTEPPVVIVTPPPVASPPPEETTPVYDTTPPASPTIATQPPAVIVQPRLAPPPAIPEATTRQTTRTTQRSVTRAAPPPAPTRARTAAPVSQAAPAETAPAAGAVPLAASPPATAPAETLPAETLPVAEAPAEARPAGAIWPWLALGALFLVGAIVLLARRRRRVDDDVYRETAFVEPVREEPIAPAAEPLAAAPLAFAAVDEPATVAPVDEVEDRETFVEDAPVAEAVTEEITVTEPDPEDVAVLAAASAPAAGRPWLEFLMRPVRAGMNDDEAVVEFDLTVGNTGTEPARDVRISTFMFAAGSAQESDMERMLIDPPAESTVSEGTIDAGDGARVEAAMTLPKAGLSDAVLPVVVADARYTLPDGSEGRTTASFEIGVPDGEDMAYFSVDNPSGLHEDIEARLRGELQRA
jgi:hypothetical protein